MLASNACNAGYYCDTNTRNCTINPKYAFTSSTTHNGNFAGLAGADSYCTTLASNAGLPGTYKAWLSSSTTSVASRMTQHTGAYVMPGGTKVADNWTDLTDGTLDATITRTESGASVPGSEPWTGSYAGGTASPNTCLNWTSSSGTDLGGNGQSSVTNGLWSSEGSNPCSTLARVYCFQQ
jgi:hypothetical protein